MIGMSIYNGKTWNERTPITLGNREIQFNLNAKQFKFSDFSSASSSLGRKILGKNAMSFAINLLFLPTQEPRTTKRDEKMLFFLLVFFA